MKKEGIAVQLAVFIQAPALIPARLQLAPDAAPRAYLVLWERLRKQTGIDIVHLAFIQFVYPLHGYLLLLHAE